jgi:hypothetical protein
MNSTSAGELTRRSLYHATGCRGATPPHLVGDEAQEKPDGAELGVEHIVQPHADTAEAGRAQRPAAARRHPDVAGRGLERAVERRRGDEAALHMAMKRSGA